jgi:hypothetical protein
VLAVLLGQGSILGLQKCQKRPIKEVKETYYRALPEQHPWEAFSKVNNLLLFLS